MKIRIVRCSVLSFCFLFLLVIFLHAESKHNVLPSNGYVPDAKTAIRIAEAVWIPIYGEETLADEKPFVAILEEGVWYVHGTLPVGSLGGTAEAEIDAVSGKILRVSHGE